MRTAATSGGHDVSARPERHRRSGRAACLLAGLALLAAAWLAPSAASAITSSADLLVRVEGRTTTLFEGPVRSEGHAIQASSDTTARTCDGTNGGHHTTPGPTPTAATVDAMTLDKLGFDGRWNPGLSDYLITSWGAEREAEGESWSLFDNDALTSVGGCQIESGEGSEILWKIGLPTAKPLLMLAPRGTTSGAPPLTATAHPGAPFALEVLAYHPKAESEPPVEPTRAGAGAVPGAEVAPVETSAEGVETVLGESGEAVTTNAEGLATITFATTGWHRLKAIATGSVRSNRLDVCVEEPGSGCGPMPVEDDIRSVTGSAEPSKPPEEPSGGGGSNQGLTTTTIGNGVTPPPPAGNVAGAHTSNTLTIGGLSLTPLDDRSRQLRFTGSWHRRAERGAFGETVSIGARGARLSVALGAGRAAIVLRDVSSGAVVAETFGSRRRTVALAPLAGGRTRLLLFARTARPQTIGIRVLKGTVGVDGVGLVH